MLLSTEDMALGLSTEIRLCLLSTEMLLSTEDGSSDLSVEVLLSN